MRSWLGAKAEQRFRAAFDWRSILALAWALFFGVLYVLMVVQERAPGVLRSLKAHAPSLIGSLSALLGPGRS